MKSEYPGAGAMLVRALEDKVAELYAERDRLEQMIEQARAWAVRLEQELAVFAPPSSPRHCRTLHQIGDVLIFEGKNDVSDD